MSGFPLRAVAAEVRDTLLQLFLQDESEEAAGHVTARCDASQNAIGGGPQKGARCLLLARLYRLRVSQQLGSYPGYTGRRANIVEKAARGPTPPTCVATRVMVRVARPGGLILAAEPNNVARAANRRLIEIERMSHDCILSEDTFQAINRPRAAGRQRASGLRFADQRVHALLHAIILFRQLAQGFRAADLRQHLAALSGGDPASISQGAITYQLRRLHLHGLIARVPKSFRYRVTDAGFRIALFFTRTYNRLLRPGLAAALPPLRAVATPLQRAFNALTTQIDAIIKDAKLAAQNLTHSRHVAFVKQG